MTRERPIAVAALALLLGRAARAFGGDVRLPPVDVPASDGPAQPPTLAEDEKDPTSFATVIRASDYGGEERSVAELAATAPGATVHRLGDLGQLATVELRGASSDEVLVLLDGIPLTSAAGGTVDLSTIPPELIDRIEVLRGDAAARYGAGALGGVVNVITRKPAQGSQAEGSVGYGEWNTVDATAAGSLAGPKRGGLLAASFFRSDGNFDYRYDPTPQLAGSPLASAVRANDQSLVAGALGSGYFRFGSSELTLVGQGSGGARGLAGPIEDPTPHDSETFGRGLAGAKWDFPNVFHAVDLELMAHGRADDLDIDVSGAGAVPQLDLDAGGSATAAIPAGRWQRLELSLGADREWLQATDAGSPARSSFYASAADELTFFADRLLLLPALRFDAQGPFDGLSPKAGFSIRPIGPLEIRGNAGLSFRAPTFAELYLQQGLVQPNPGLVPERGESADLGVAVTAFRTLASLVAFVSSYQDLIVYEVTPPYRVKPFNVGRAWIEGLEASLSSRPIPSLTLEASYTLLVTWNDDPASVDYGDPLPYRPPQHAHGRAVWQRGDFQATLEGDYASAQPLNDSGSLTLPGHFVLDAGASVRVFHRPDVWLAAEVKNLTNDQALDVFGYPLPGTSFFLSLRSSSPNQGAVP
ncbi:MAG: TonB-dependent receptor plug domain-containing protein [Myxococcales bacterium]